MDIIIWIYLILMILSGIFLFGLAAYIIKKYLNEDYGKTALFLSIMLFAGSIWTFGNFLSLISTPSFVPLIWNNIAYIGIILIPPSWMLLALKWTGKGRWFTKKKILLPYIIPCVNIFLIFTNNLHNIFWEKIQIISTESIFIYSLTHNIGWWFHATYSYLLILVGIFYLLRGLINLRRIYKKQAFVLLIGCFLPWITNMFFIFILVDLPYDPTPIPFVITGFIFTWGISRLHLIELTPYAKEEVFEHLTNPTFVFDNYHRLVELNPSAENMFQLKDRNIIGKKINLVFKDYPNILNKLKSKSKHIEVCVQNQNKKDYFKVLLTPIKRDGRQSGYILSLQDITDSVKSNIALRKNEEKFRTFTESASIAILIYQDNYWIYANAAAEKITGYSKKELLKMTFWEFIHPDFRELTKQRGKARQNGKNPPSNYEIKIITKNGYEKWADLNTKIITFSGKRAVLVTALDITERKKSRKTINKQLTAIKSSMDGIAILNKKGEYLYVNDAHATIYGYDSPEDLIGKNWRILYNEKELKRFDEEIMPAFFKCGRWRGEAVGKKKDGTTFDQEVTLTAIEDGLICVVRDITKQKMMLRELEDAHELLYIINKDLKRKVKQRTQEIERLVKQKDDFINQLGHDLKTPLTPMMVLLPILKEKVQTEKDNELFEVIIRNVYFMKDLVNKTIDLAKLNTDKIEFNMEPLTLADEIEAVLKNNQVIFDENNIEVSSTINPTCKIIGDKLRIQEVFNNLLTNAIKYTPDEGGFISISAEENKSGKITISVSDSGIGMTKEQLNNMFDEFYKADESRHNLDSSGLGLSITKKIIEKHGGKIWAESKGSGKGSTFFFTLKKAENKKKIEQAQSQ